MTGEREAFVFPPGHCCHGARRGQSRRNPCAMIPIPEDGPMSGNRTRPTVTNSWGSLG